MEGKFERSGLLISSVVKIEGTYTLKFFCSLVIDEILQHKELDPNLEDGSFTEEEAKV